MHESKQSMGKLKTWMAASILSEKVADEIGKARVLFIEFRKFSFVMFSFHKCASLNQFVIGRFCFFANQSQNAYFRWSDII